ncbi:hypothetical protein RB595_003484 [Gaeumannomyces hyphopodioides]
MHETNTGPQVDAWALEHFQDSAVQEAGMHMNDIYGFQGAGIQELGLQRFDLPAGDNGHLMYHVSLHGQIDVGSYSAGVFESNIGFLGAPGLVCPQHVNVAQTQQQVGSAGLCPFGTDPAFAQVPLAAPAEGPWSLPYAPPSTEAPAMPPGSTATIALPLPPAPLPSTPKSHACRNCNGRVFKSNKDLVRHHRSKHWPYTYQC